MNGFAGFERGEGRVVEDAIEGSDVFYVGGEEGESVGGSGRL